jgi:signal recognition particle receptor subunit beta
MPIQMDDELAIKQWSDYFTELDNKMRLVEHNQEKIKQMETVFEFMRSTVEKIDVAVALNKLDFKRIDGVLESLKQKIEIVESSNKAKFEKIEKQTQIIFARLRLIESFIGNE